MAGLGGRGACRERKTFQDITFLYVYFTFPNHKSTHLSRLLNSAIE